MVQEGTHTLDVIGEDLCAVVITHRDTTYECGHQGELAPEHVVHHEHLAAVEVQLLDIHQQILQSSITTVGLLATLTTPPAYPAKRHHPPPPPPPARRPPRPPVL